MRPEVKTYSSAGEQAPIPVDTSASDFKVGLQVVVTGTSSSDVEYTMSPDLTSAAWFKHDTLTSVTANTSGNIVIPITAVRLNVTAYTDGEVEFTVLQGG